jgi:hypothetical protein
MVLFQVENNFTGESLLVVVIERDNLERMEHADPITLRSARFGGVLGTIEYPDNLRVIVAFESDSGHLYEFLQRQDKNGLLQYLMRGYELQSKDRVPGGTGTA